MKIKPVFVSLAAMFLLMLNSCCCYVTSENVYTKSWDDAFMFLACVGAFGIGCLFRRMPRLFLVCAFIVFIG